MIFELKSGLIKPIIFSTIIPLFIGLFFFYVFRRKITSAESCAMIRFMTTKDRVSVPISPFSLSNQDKKIQPLSHDYLAFHFIPTHVYNIVRYEIGRRIIKYLYEHRFFKGGIGFVSSRARFFDDILEHFLEAEEKGIEQIVILGAGFDTRSYRFAKQIIQKNISVFEVDMRSSLRHKRDLIRNRVGIRPKHVKYVSCDFNKTHDNNNNNNNNNTNYLQHQLNSNHFTNKKRTLFLAEGLFVYLEPKAVDTILEVCASCPRGSTIAFDYVYQGIVDNEPESMERLYGSYSVQRTVKKIGEPLRFGIAEGKPSIEQFLAEHGLTLTHWMDYQDLSRDYLTKPNGSKLYPIVEYSPIAMAEVS